MEQLEFVKYLDLDSAELIPEHPASAPNGCVRAVNGEELKPRNWYRIKSTNFSTCQHQDWTVRIGERLPHNGEGRPCPLYPVEMRSRCFDSIMKLNRSIYIRKDHPAFQNGVEDCCDLEGITVHLGGDSHKLKTCQARKGEWAKFSIEENLTPEQLLPLIRSRVA